MQNSPTNLVKLATKQAQLFSVSLFSVLFLQFWSQALEVTTWLVALDSVILYLSLGSFTIFGQRQPCQILLRGLLGLFFQPI